MKSLPLAVSPEGPLRTALTTILPSAIVGPNDGKDSQVIGLVIPLEPDGGDWVDQAATILDRHPNCAGLVVSHPKHLEVPEGLRPGLRVAFVNGVRPASMQGNLLNTLLAEAAWLRDHPCPVSVMNRVRDIVFAKALWKKVELFSHGAELDITNEVLAPLRLLWDIDPHTHVSVDESHKNFLELFSQIVLERDHEWWLAKSIERNLGVLLAGNGLDLRMAVEGMMDLLTECRILAGAGAVPGRGKKASNPRGRDQVAIDTEKAFEYRILVIDDHWRSWQQVFAKLKEKFSQKLEGKHCLFESLPVENRAVAEITATALQRLPSFDAVLLDIFIREDIDGLDILESIRRHYVNVPVILWTSSREIDLPARARLAHGFLFKKTSTSDEITKVLAGQLREGRARRLYPLPGHFFDQSIRDEDNRKCAVRFTEYCSKQLGGFHALDDQYFRYFTDHGGRHLFKLLEHLGEALRPLVEDREVFAFASPEEREDEILALYLAVFLHEFGMLRLQGKQEPVWNDLILRSAKDEGVKKLLEGELNLVRNLHAVRGMILLAKNPKEEPEIHNHWPDEEGQHQAHKRFILKKRRSVQVAVALITGHHSRLLPLNLNMHGEWSHDFTGTYHRKVESALNSLPAQLKQRVLDSIPMRFYALNEVEKALMSLIGSIKCPHRLGRLRKQCAIFRFVDAIDVDQSRNPARFLCVARRIGHIDRRETLKRQVVRKVKIEGGTVHMQTNVPPPQAPAVLEIISREARSESVNEALKELILQLREQPNQLQEWISNPWRNPNNENRKWRILCHQVLDSWLASFWWNPSSDGYEGLLTKYDKKYTDESKLLIASLTALSVAWEILDEYKAIADCDLADKIRLGNFWRDTARDGVYDPQSQQNMLTILFHPKEGLDSVMD